MHKSPTAFKPSFKTRALRESFISDESKCESNQEFEMLPEETNALLNEQTLPLLRDPNNKFAPLERLFGVLNHGCAFGEYSVQSSEKKQRFYTPVALSKCLYLCLDKEKFESLVSALEKQTLLGKLQFMRAIPEFNTVGLSRTRLQTFC